MNAVHTAGEALAALRDAKAGATDFRTNFFPSEAKLQGWIDHSELFSDVHEGATFFLRKDRDFWHLYFCAASPDALQSQAAKLSILMAEPVVTDVVGNQPALEELLARLESVGLRRYARLQRMARAQLREPSPSPATGDSPVVCADKADCSAILALIESAFDRCAEQLPQLYEIESAVDHRQVLVAKRDQAVAGLLFFETQGLASSIRFWAVARQFHSLGIGSLLMRHYFGTQSAVRRFTLWVNTVNENAITKYGHYGYAPDGLVDHVLANHIIPT
jgi:ribosomal protein S18 acetylase RimI-like enzyme